MSYLRRLQISDKHGHVADVSENGELQVVTPVKLVGAGFYGTTIDSNFWANYASGTGAGATQATGLVTIASGTANSGISHFYSAKKARWLLAHPNLFRSALRIPTLAVANNKRRWGAFSHSSGVPQNGFYFEIDATGALSVVTCSGASPTAVGSGSFNLAPGGTYTLDTNIHVFEIQYFMKWVTFMIDGEPIHRVTATTAATSGDFLLPVGATSVNDASGTTSGTIEVMAAIIVREGRIEAQPRSLYQSGTTAGIVLKRGPGILREIVITNVGANAAITLYDNTAASGTVLFATGAMGALTQPFSVTLDSIPFEIGLTLVIATTAADVVVVYE